MPGEFWRFTHFVYSASRWRPHPVWWTLRHTIPAWRRYRAESEATDAR